MGTTVIQTETCPACGKEMRIIKGYHVWCVDCNWNIDPDRYELKRKNAFHSIYSWLNSRYRDRVFKHAIAGKRPSALQLDTAAAYILASTVYLLLVFLVWTVISSILGGITNGEMVKALFCSLFLIALLPRKTKIHGVRLSRGEHAALYTGLDEICAVMQIKPIEKIYVNTEYNAFVYSPLFSKQVILVLGIPLLAILDRSEILALLGHELGHLRNKDIANRRYLSMAFSSLCEWYQMIRFNDDFWFFKVAMYPLRLVFSAMISLMGLCLWRQQQVAEYAADREAVRLAGVPAALGLIQKSYHGITFELTVEKAAGYSGKIPIFDRFKEKLQHLPELELLRIERIMDLETSKVSSSHPPHRYRMEFIRQQDQLEAALAIDGFRFDGFVQAIRVIEKSMEANILRDYREFLAESG